MKYSFLRISGRKLQMDGRERAKRFLAARTGLNKNGEEGKQKVYELTGVPASAIVLFRLIPRFVD